MMILRAAPTLRRRCLAVPAAALLLLLPGRARATGGEDLSAPSALPFYLSRLPAKSPSQVFLETTPRPPAKPTDFRARLLDLAVAAEAGRAPAAALLPSVDELLVQARLDPNNAAVLCNLLNDARDLFASTPPVAGKPAAEYLRWRVQHAESFGLSWTKKKPAANAGAEDERLKKLKQQALAEVEHNVDDPGQRLLRVHWLYLQGALSWDAGTFARVAREFPDHPRAEAARFMVARFQFSAYRALSSNGDRFDAKTSRAREAARDKARGLFEDYLRQYPAGRFIADAPGWLGAIAYDGEDYLAALDLYLRQADTPGHPEVLKSAGFMCERCLSHLSTTGDQQALERVAEHPKLAMSLIYLVVNSSESDDYNGKYDTPAEVAKWRRTLLPRLAAAVTAHKDAYQTGDWQGRYLAILAQAASGSGDQKKALALCDLGKEDLARLDDLAFIRLTALQRGGDLRATIDAGRDFAARFPRSVLARGAALRVAMALRDDRQAGAAVVELLKLQHDATGTRETTGRATLSPVDGSTGSEASGPADDDPIQYPQSEVGLSASDSVLTHDLSGAEYNQTQQIIDALLNFAPLPELAAVLPAGNLDEAFAMRLRAILAQRWLAEGEDFARAREFVTPAQWSVAAAAVEKAAAVAGAHPADPAALQALGDAWAAARGKLVFAPLETEDTRDWVFQAGGMEGTDADGLRLVNAHALGITGELGAAVEKRDELRHARDWWLRVADAAPAGSPARAHALWLALKAMPALAAASPALTVRAAVTDARGASRQLYERLRRECPASREAREFAVYYDFSAPKKAGDGEAAPASTAADESADDLRDPEYAVSDHGVFTPQREGDPFQDGREGDNYLTKVAALRTSRSMPDPTRLAPEVLLLRRSIHAHLASPYGAYLQNCLDDLDDFLKEDRAKLTPAAVHRYFDLRIECLAVESWGNVSNAGVAKAVGLTLGTGDDAGEPGNQPLGYGKGIDDRVFNDIRAAYRQPELAPFKDYLDFLAIAVVANHQVTVPVPGQEKDGQPLTYTSRDYPELEKLTETFLNEQPHSRKREAARLLYARAIYNASRPRLVQQFAVWPQSGTFANRLLDTHQRVEPFDPARLGAALNAYDREFPQGRYAADIRNLRGLLAWRTQDWKIALDLTLKTLDDKNAPDLQPEAALRLANIFSDGLTDDTERARLVAAIRAQSGAPEKLRAYLEVCGKPLCSLKSWLLEASNVFH